VWGARGEVFFNPARVKRLHFLGGTVGGGTGAMAMAWDPRFSAASLEVPSFGNHPLRVTLQCNGSGESVRRYYHQHPEVLEVLKYHDAAIMARHIHIPVLCACALFDPAVPPPGQFAVYNAIAGPKQLFTARAGHFAHPGEADDNAELRRLQHEWFSK
jgi:cephalosporin-C deacetylase